MIIVQQPNFKVGDRVRVTNVGQCYSSYKKFVSLYAPSYISKWQCGGYLSGGDIVTIVALHQHPTAVEQGELAVIYDGNGAFVININGLELLPSPKSIVILKP